MGDFDGDGTWDLVVGAATHTTSALGAAYLVLGSTSPSRGDLAD